MARNTEYGDSRRKRSNRRPMVAACAVFVGVFIAPALAAAEIGATHVAAWKDDRRAPFVLMFDDSMPSHVKTVLPELKKRKLIGTFYINPGSGHYKSLKDAWEKDFPAAGMVLANHTFTHKGARDVPHCEEEITQCNDVLNAIATAGGGKRPTLISFGRPGVPQGAWNVTDEELATLLVKHRLVRRPDVFFAQIHLKDAVAMIARVQKALDSGKPDTVAFHGVGGEWLSIDLPSFLALLDFIDAKREQLWVTDPISIHKYETERDTAKVEVVESGPTQIRLQLRNQSDPAIYDAPLTLVTQVPPEWKTVAVTQSTHTATVTASQGVVRYEAWAGADPIVLKASPSAAASARSSTCDTHASIRPMDVSDCGTRKSVSCRSALPADESVPVVFPGAEGYGSRATGGRGGRVLFVDSLADDAKNPPPCTFRWACETETGPRIVVFRTAGLIELQRSVDVKHGDLTIAAQTAPGDGVCLRGSQLSIAADNVIVRGLRSRPGDGKIGIAGQYRHALSLNGPVSRVIIDHCSLSWGVDGIFQAYGNKQGEAPGSFTVQWCILSECLSHSIHAQGDHSCALVVGGGNVKQFSLHHNLLAHNGARNPRLVWGAQGDFVNNVIYDWAGQAMILEPFNPVKVKRDKRRPSSEEQTPMLLNVIGNTWIAGKDSRTDRSEIILKHMTSGTKIYLHDNVGPHRRGELPAGDQESSITRGSPAAFDTTAPALPVSLPIQPHLAARNDVLKSAGATAPRRDAVDLRTIQEVTQENGRIIDSPADVGGYPDYRTAETSADADQDGMPDAWERAHGLDPTRANSAGHDLHPQFDNIEVYVNSFFR